MQKRIEQTTADIVDLDKPRPPAVD